ncbi:MAG: signal recognition particle protein [Clostridiales Family XIII bacterium]|jgi:signal recognition particle subunit SRP54|nr:signal recognition particle protein [Clostridiales Family XIII bacterium]
MAFEGLSEKLQGVFKKLKGKGVLTEADIDEAMREVKLALLEADVNFKVVKDFVRTVSEKAKGSEIHAGLNPAQQVIKIVQDELVGLMGGTNSKLTFSPSGFTAIMLVGLQGTGKTTTAGKLAKWLRSEGKQPMLCACDIYRPAAIDQLEVVGRQTETPVFTDRESRDPSDIARRAIKDAQVRGYNILIIDTAGRLQIDEALMGELKDLKKQIRPHEILLVVDAMTGQDAVNAAEGFNDALGVDGIIMTKLDGDSRGGAALSTKSVTGKPIKFIGVGEKLDALEPFHPDRMASRILGMGDVLSLIEKVEREYDDEQAEALERKMRKNEFTLEDFLDQMGQIKKMGGLASLIGMIPGAGKVKDDELEQGEKDLVRMEAVMRSMTKAERRDPAILNASRRKRIAAGSGQPVSMVNTLVKRYEESRKLMRQYMGGGGKRGKRLPNIPGLFS